MSNLSFLDHIAYYQNDGEGPGVLFLHGYRSDMEGTKAIALELWTREWGKSYTRFDMRGHGLSKVAPDFSQLKLSDWLEDAMRVLTELTTGPQILVGSSMGGWLALLLAQRFPERVKHVVGIACAPDFSKRIPQEAIRVEGGYSFGNDSFASDDFIMDADTFCLLHKSLDLQCDITLLQGKADDVVPWQLAEQIKQAAAPRQCEIIYIQDGDHRLNTPEDLELLKKATFAAF